MDRALGGAVDRALGGAGGGVSDGVGVTPKGVGVVPGVLAVLAVTVFFTLSIPAEARRKASLAISITRN